MRKVETPIFLVEKPSNETTATTFNISGIQAQHDEVAMAMHGITTETRYIHVHVPKKQNSKFHVYQWYGIILLQICQFWREIHKKKVA